MKLNKPTTLLIFGLVLYTNAVFPSSSDAQGNQDFVELCNIYQEISHIDIDLPSKEGELTQRIIDKLPTLFNRMYTHVMKADPSRRYELISQYKRQLYGNRWECQSALIYYKTAFQKQ
jgi:hypothetical protein